MSGGISATTVLLAATAAVGAYAAISSGQAQKQTAADNAELERRKGAQDLDAATAQADKIRKAGAVQQSQAKAALASSGVSIGDGTAVKINEQIDLNAENDAYSTILSGKRSANSSATQAAMYDKAGDNALSAGYLNAGSSLLASGAAIGKGWKTSAGAGSGGSLGSGVSVPTSFLAG